MAKLVDAPDLGSGTARCEGSSPFARTIYMESVVDIKEMVSQGKKVTFVRYQNGELWYSTECGLEFPVPVDDTGNAAFMASDRAMLFMRWINKHLKMLEAAKLTA